MTDLYKFDSFDIPYHVLETVPDTRVLDEIMRKKFESRLSTEIPSLSTADQTWLRWAIHSATLLHIQRAGVENQDQLDMFNYCCSVVADCEGFLRSLNFFTEPDETVH